MMDAQEPRSPPGKLMAHHPTVHDREPRHEMEEQAAIQSGKIAEAARRSFLWRLTRSFREATKLMSSRSRTEGQSHSPLPQAPGSERCCPRTRLHPRAEA